ncbi:MAG TPA: phage tail sheath C-terminal domain-containing protein, partial [Candidatus Manganitrophaceae bacterium]|nr:phage tail sheath C-terminal domain-containing protein [Candidatus Manganitrophaceae bacterium]
SSYLTPGIYVEEVQTGTRPIGAVGTSTAAFLGVAPVADAHLNEAFACNNWSQFAKEFIGEGSPSTHLARAVYGFFGNGGGRCYVVNVGKDKTGRDNPITSDARQRTGIRCLEPIDEIAIVAAPGYTDPISYETLLSYCEKWGCFAILDAPPDAVKNIDLLKKVATVDSGDTAAADTGKSTKGATPATTGMRPRNSDYAAFNFPWIIINDPVGSGGPVSSPPSGHIAGVYARTDATRGVHKAPANERIAGAVGLNYLVTHEEQGELNRMGVNCIRSFSDAGLLLWGGRTLAEESSQWRYINVRRLFNMIEKSIAAGTRWVVFEPNDVRTWKNIERNIRHFLLPLYRDGALKGNTPEEAFFVKCDAETNPPEVIDAGRLVTEIGIAPVKPAEFIIFRIGQWEGGVEVEAAKTTK